MKNKYILPAIMIGVFGFGLVSMASYVDPEGDVKGKVKAYESSRKYVKSAKVRLYKKSGKRVDSDKSNSKGKYKFEDIAVGKYYIKCGAKGYVNAKKPNKKKYTTSIFKVKEGKTTKKNCRLMLADKNDNIDYSERPKGTSKREWRIIKGL